MTKIDGFKEFATLLEEFEDDLKEIADEVDEAIHEGTKTTALQIERTAKKKAPVEDGELRADIQANPLRQGVFTVGTTREYAAPTEYGSRPHPITPNGPYPLRFQKNGEWIATYLVNHPGTPAQPFLRPALNKHRSDLIQNIQEEIEELIDSEL